MWKLIQAEIQLQEMNEPFDDVTASCVYFVVRGRNAWHGTWTSVYFNAAAFHPGLNVAEAYVEKCREQGSTWTIWQLPALAICGSNYAVVVTEVNMTHPLLLGPQEPVDIRTIGSIARSFERRNV